MSTIEQDSAMIERLIRVETKLDHLLQMTDPKLADHETRLRTLEAKVWAASGAAAIVGALAGWLLPLLQH